MKSLKYFFGMLLIASVVGLVSSCKDPEDKPKFETDYPEAPKEAGKITIFAKFEAEVCGDVVLAGSYRLKEGSTTSWSENPAELTKFVPAGVIDGKDWSAEGWYKVTVDLTPSAAGSKDEFGDYVLGAKPVHLDDGDFDWAFQIGHKDHDPGLVIVKSGEVEVLDGFTNECDVFFLSNATAAIIFKTWKNDPCNIIRHDYTFNVTVPSGTPSDAEVYIAGDMNGWSVDANKLTQSGSQYSIKINNVKEGSSYKYVLNGTWDNEELAVTGSEGCAEGISNRVTGSSSTINDKVENWRKITVDKCGDGSFPDAATVAGKITIFAKFEADFCGEIGLVGTNNDWNDNPDNLPRFVSAGVIDGKDWGAAGWWKITVDLNENTAFNWGDKGSGVLAAKPIQLTEDGKFFWDYQVGFDDDEDIELLAGGVDVLPSNPGECDILFRTNVTAVFIFHKWKNDPCVEVPSYSVKFNVTVPEAIGDAVVRIVGGFGTSGYPNWSPDAEEMKLTKGADGKYSITLNLKEGDIEYKYVANGDWPFEERGADDGTDCAPAIDFPNTNRSITVTGAATQNDVVENFKGITTCLPPSPPFTLGAFTWISDSNPNNQNGWALDGNVRGYIADGTIKYFVLALKYSEIDFTGDNKDGIGGLDIIFNSTPQGWKQNASPWEGWVNKDEILDKEYTDYDEDNDILYIWYDLTQYSDYEGYKSSMGGGWAQFALQYWSPNIAALHIVNAYLLGEDDEIPSK